MCTHTPGHITTQLVRQVYCQGVVSVYQEASVSAADWQHRHATGESTHPVVGFHYDKPSCHLRSGAVARCKASTQAGSKRGGAEIGGAVKRVLHCTSTHKCGMDVLIT